MGNVPEEMRARDRERRGRTRERERERDRQRRKKRGERVWNDEKVITWKSGFRGYQVIITNIKDKKKEMKVRATYEITDYA